LFVGNISNLRVVKSAVYTAAFTPPAAPLTAVTGMSLLACQDNRFKDNGPNNLAITKNGDTSVSRFNPFGSSGVVATTNLASAGSVSLPGGSFATVPGGTPFTFAGDFTIECWFNQTVSVGYACLWSTVTNYPSAGLRLINSGAGTGLMLGGTGTENVFPPGTETGAPAFTNGTWNHVAVVRSGSTLTMYLNGQNVGSVAGFTRTVSSDTFQIGQVSSSYRYNGYISDLRVVKGTAVYTSNFTPSTSPLTAITNTTLLTAQAATGVTDASSNAATVTLGGSAAAVEASPFRRVTYPFGGSAYFDGLGDCFMLTDSTAFAFGTSDFTVEMFIFPLSVASGILYDSRPAYTNGAHPILAFSGGVLLYQTSTGNVAGTTQIAANAWHHVALTRSGTTVRIFVDGVLHATRTDAASLINGANRPIIGADGAGGPNGTGDYFKGYMSGLRVVKGVAVYTANFTPPVEPVKAIGGTSLLLNFDNAGVYDSSGNVNMQSLGDAKTSTAVVKYGTASNAFDGTGDRLWTNKVSGNFDLTGQFTVEAWVNFTATAGKTNYIFNYLNDSEAGWMLRYVNTGALRFYMGASSVVDRSWTAALNTWYHVAATRDSSNNVRLFIDGVQQGAAVSISDAATQTQYGLQIGGTDLQGFVDEARVTKGVARYTTNFTVPSASFPTKAG
jgi:hypothetical protein